MSTVVSGHPFDLREWSSNWTPWNFEVSWRGLGGPFFRGMDSSVGLSSALHLELRRMDPVHKLSVCTVHWTEDSETTEQSDAVTEEGLAGRSGSRPSTRHLGVREWDTGRASVDVEGRQQKTAGP